MLSWVSVSSLPVSCRTSGVSSTPSSHPTDTPNSRLRATSLSISGQGRVGLPFINCLPAEAKPVSQSFLRESLFFSLLRDALANRHSAPLLLDGISIERAGVLCYQPEGGKLSTSG